MFTFDSTLAVYWQFMLIWVPHVIKSYVVHHHHKSKGMDGYDMKMPKKTTAYAKDDTLTGRFIPHPEGCHYSLGYEIHMPICFTTIHHSYTMPPSNLVSSFPSTPMDHSYSFSYSCSLSRPICLYCLHASQDAFSFFRISVCLAKIHGAAAQTFGRQCSQNSINSGVVFASQILWRAYFASAK
jgi:hypothetical protein